MTPTDMLRMALYALGIVLLVMGAVVALAQVRLWASRLTWWWEGRKDARQTEKLLRGRR